MAIIIIVIVTLLFFFMILEVIRTNIRYDNLIQTIYSEKTKSLDVGIEISKSQMLREIIDKGWPNICKKHLETKE